MTKVILLYFTNFCYISLFCGDEISLLTQQGQIKRIKASFERRFHDVILQGLPTIKLFPQLRENGKHCYSLPLSYPLNEKSTKCNF